MRLAPHHRVSALEAFMDRDEFAKLLDDAIRSKSFSGVVSIDWQGANVYERAFGYADRSNSVENAMDTRFKIASGTKFLTALAIDSGIFSLTKK
jgi:CubicO group peptidase (beta-lactamase class C family)